MYINKFDNIYASIIMEDNKIYKWLTGTWPLKDEFKILVPLLLKKINNAFGSFYESNKPGPPDIISERSELLN
jgi:hypothetical protein